MKSFYSPTLGEAELVKVPPTKYILVDGGGEPDFKVGGVWGGPSDGKAYQLAVRTCRP